MGVAVLPQWGPGYHPLKIDKYMFKIVRFCAKQCYVLPIKKVIDFVLKAENLYAFINRKSTLYTKRKRSMGMSNFDA